MRRWAWTVRVALLAVSALLIGCDGQPSEKPLAVSMNVAVDRRPWRTPHAMGYSATSEHYRVFCTARRAALKAHLPGFMEAAYANYLRLTGLPDDPSFEPMPLYLLGTREEWAALTEKVLGSGSGALGIRAGGYCHNGTCVLWDMGGTGTMAVASHEGLHQFFHHRLRDRLPMWLEEGLCVQAEGHAIRGDGVVFTPLDNPKRFSVLRRAIVNGRTIPLAELLNMHSMDAIDRQREEVGQEASIYYGQLWALTAFLRDSPTYRPRMERMLADAAGGRFYETLRSSPDSAFVNVPESAMEELRRRPRIYNRTVSTDLFKAYINPDMEAFEREYMAYARKLVKLPPA